VARVVYCGGCNPEIDRAAIARELDANAAPEQTAIAGSEPTATAWPTVLLSGCARACASDHQLVDESAGPVVAGELVDGVPTPVGAIAAAIARKLER
jgi:hypothetical protein